MDAILSMGNKCCPYKNRVRNVCCINYFSVLVIVVTFEMLSHITKMIVLGVDMNHS